MGHASQYVRCRRSEPLVAMTTCVL